MAREVERIVKFTIEVTDNGPDLYSSKTRAHATQAFPTEVVTLGTVSAWTARTVANAVRDAERSYPLAVDIVEAPPTALDRPLAAVTDDDAEALEALPF